MKKLKKTRFSRRHSWKVGQTSSSHPLQYRELYNPEIWSSSTNIMAKNRRICIRFVIVILRNVVTKYSSKFIWSWCLSKMINMNVAKNKNQRSGSHWTVPKKRTRIKHRMKKTLIHVPSNRLVVRTFFLDHVDSTW